MKRFFPMALAALMLITATYPALTREARQEHRIIELRREKEEPIRSLDGAEMDGQGCLWAFSRLGSDHLYTFDGKQWNARPVSLAPDDPSPRKMVRMADGAVVCVWSLGNRRLGLTRHLGQESRIILKGTADISSNAFVGDSQNRLWVFGMNGEILRIDTRNGATLSYQVKKQDLLDLDLSTTALAFDNETDHPSPNVIENYKKHWNPLTATEDGRGRIWVRSNANGSDSFHQCLRGVLIFDGDKVERRDITGIVESQFTVLERKDQQHMWLGVRGDGLYEVDIDTLQASPVPAPDPKVFRLVESLFAMDGDLYVLSRVTYRTSLWRLRGGHWERILSDFKLGVLRNFDWIPLKNGLLLCVGDSPWYIGKDTPPVQLDWRDGFPYKAVTKLMHCTDGRFFCLGSEEEFFHRTLRLPPQRQDAATRVTSLDIIDGCVLGDKHFCTLDSKGILKIREGKAWHEYALPKKLEVRHIRTLATDQFGRIWFLPNISEVVAAFFDPRTEQWNIFDGLEAAFKAVKDEQPSLTTLGPSFFIPRYSASGGRIAFFSEEQQIAYFDGTKWMRWSRDEINPENPRQIGSPFFDAQDKLCVNTNDDKTWQYNGNGNWRAKPDFEFSNFALDNPIDFEPVDRNTPPGAIPLPVASSVRDNHGTFWLIGKWNAELYKYRDGTTISVFAAREPHPFTAQRQLMGVWEDSDGTIFLKTGQRREWFQVAPKSPPPQMSVSVTENAAPDAVRVQFQSTSPSKLRLRWQLDDEPWQPTEAWEFTLESLPAGEHTVRVQASDEELQSEPMPAQEKFVIKIDSAKQIAELITRLSSPDFTRRKAAIKALARQPAAALSSLKSAHLTANDNQRWWIDAAIQECERSQHSQAKNL